MFQKEFVRVFESELTGNSPESSFEEVTGWYDEEAKAKQKKCSDEKFTMEDTANKFTFDQ